MPTMDANGSNESLPCPKIVGAVLKALRGDWNDAETLELLARHIPDCPGCRGRIASLNKFVQAMIAAPPDRAGAGGPPESSRRRYRRLATNEAVNLVLHDGNVILARMIEVSARGAKIESPEALDRDSTFTLNRGRRSTPAAVRHCSPSGDLFLIGVEYTNHPAHA